MAKYTVLMSCGHEEEIVLFGKTSERERKIEYFKSCGLCKECYKKKIDEKNKAEGLTLHIAASPCIDTEDGGFLLCLWFSGDTITYKDKIKSLGYNWCRSEYNDYKECWTKTIKEEKLDEEKEKAAFIGAKNFKLESGLLTDVNCIAAFRRQEKWKEKQEKFAAIEKPLVPDILLGRKWNRKVYGKSGRYVVYLDSQEVAITDDQAKELKAYIGKKEEYERKIKEIEKG